MYKVVNIKECIQGGQRAKTTTSRKGVLGNVVEKVSFHDDGHVGAVERALLNGLHGGTNLAAVKADVGGILVKPDGADGKFIA